MCALLPHISPLCWGRCGCVEALHVVWLLSRLQACLFICQVMRKCPVVSQYPPDIAGHFPTLTLASFPLRDGNLHILVVLLFEIFQSLLDGFLLLWGCGSRCIDTASPLSLDWLDGSDGDACVRHVGPARLSAGGGPERELFYKGHRGYGVGRRVR